MTTHRHCCCEDPLAGHYGIVVIKNNYTEDTVYDLGVKNPTTHYHMVFPRGDYYLPKGVTLFSQALKLPGISTIFPNTNNPNVLRTKWLDFSQIRPKWGAPNYLGTSDEDVPMFTDPPTRITWGTPNGDAKSQYTLSFFLPEQYKDYEITEIESHHNFLTNLNLNKEICGDCGVVQGANFTSRRAYGIYSDLYTLFYNYIPIKPFLYGRSLAGYFREGVFFWEDTDWPKLKTYLSDVLLPDNCCAPNSGCVPTYNYGNKVCNKSLNADTQIYFTSGAKELDRKLRTEGGLVNTTVWQHIDSKFVGDFVSLGQGTKLFTSLKPIYFIAQKCGIPTREFTIELGGTYCLPECGGTHQSTSYSVFDLGPYYYFKETLASYNLWQEGKEPSDQVRIVRFCPVEYTVDGEIKKKIIITDVLDTVRYNTFHQNVRNKPIPKGPFESRSWPSYIQPTGVTLEIFRVEPNSLGSRTIQTGMPPCGLKEYVFTLCFYKRRLISTTTRGTICGIPRIDQVCETEIYELSQYDKRVSDSACAVYVADLNAYYASISYSKNLCCINCGEATRRNCGEECTNPDLLCGGCYTETFSGGAELIDEYDVFFQITNAFGRGEFCSVASGLLGTKRICDGTTIQDDTQVVNFYPPCGGGCGEVTYPNPNYSSQLANMYDRYQYTVLDTPIESNPAPTYASSNGKTITFSNTGNTGDFFDQMFKKYAEAQKNFYATQFGTTVNIKKYLIAYQKEQFDPNCQTSTCKKKWVDVLKEKRYGILLEVQPGSDGTIPGGNAEFVIPYQPYLQDIINSRLETDYNTDLLSAGHIGSFVKNVYRCSKNLNSCGNTLFLQLCNDPSECDTTIKTKYQNLCKSVIGHYGITWPKGLTGETAEREKILNLTDIFPTQPLFQNNITEEEVLGWCIPRQPIKDPDISDIMKGLSKK